MLCNTEFGFVLLIDGDQYKKFELKGGVCNMNKGLQKVSIVTEVNIFVSSQKHNLRYNAVLEQRKEGMFEGFDN